MTLDSNCIKEISCGCTLRLILCPLPGSFLFASCSHLERLSIKNATCTHPANEDDSIPVCQDLLTKMVCNHPTLRWLRSDLTDESVAMLKQERPEITFVSK